MYSMIMVIIPEIVGAKKMSMVSGFIGMTLGCSGILGPVLGGLISRFSTWRWIFYIKYVIHSSDSLPAKIFSIPFGCFVIATILIAWPPTPGTSSSLSAWATFQSVDVLGIFLILAASCMHIFAFESAGVLDFEWNSPTILSLLVLSASCWITFVLWQLFLESRRQGRVQPVFPFRIVRHRVMVAVVL